MKGYASCRDASRCGIWSSLGNWSYTLITWSPNWHSITLLLLPNLFVRKELVNSAHMKWRGLHLGMNVKGWESLPSILDAAYQSYLQRVYIYIYIYIYTHTHTYIYIHIHIYIYIYSNYISSVKLFHVQSVEEVVYLCSMGIRMFINIELFYSL